jgi:undecaprenyl-diphosphatase
MFHFDLSVLHYIQGWQQPWLTPVMKGLTLLFTPEILIPVIGLVLLGLIVKHKRWQEIILLLILAGNVMTLALKPVLHRPRPTADQAIILDHQSSSSMPSGHAMMVMTLGGAVVLLAHHRQRASKKLVASVAISIVLVGVSRVYLGAHWPSDVLVSYLLGFLWVAFVWRIVRPILQKHPRLSSGTIIVQDPPRV